MSSPPPATGSPPPDLFLSYNGADRQAVAQIERALRQRQVSTFFDQNNLKQGMFWFDALQKAVNDVRAVAVFIGKDGLGRWQKREMALALDRQVKEEKQGAAFPVIPVVLPQADVNLAAGFLLLNTWVDFRRGLDDPAALEDLARAVRGEATESQRQAITLPPYRGLKVFREEDAPLFFGRERFTSSLFEKTLSRQLVAVVGASGSGKSSVVQAGLLPRLRRQYPPADVWEAVIFTPGNRPFHRLAAALIPLWEPDIGKTDQLIKAEELGGHLLKGEVSLEAAVALALREGDEAAANDLAVADRLLVVVDQFEELFTLTPEDQRATFVTALLGAARSESVTILLTLRADFYGQAISLSGEMSDKIEQGIVNIGPMERKDLRSCIEEPARYVGLGFEPNLVELILDHVESQPGSLPLLEFTLTQLWERREGGLMTHRQYEEIGGVRGAISKHAEKVFSDLPQAQQELAERLLTRLVRVSAANEEGMDTRQRVKLSDLDAESRQVAREFVKKRLLVGSLEEEDGEDKDEGEPNGARGEAVVEVAHEALITRWDRLKALINENRRFLLWRQRLILRMDEWKETKQDKGALLQGALLDEAKRWRKERGKELNQAEHEYIASSEKLFAPGRALKVGAATAAVAVLALVAFFGWRAWLRSDSYQINAILKEAPTLVSQSDEPTVDDWYFALAVTGRKDEMLSAAKWEKTPRYLQSLINVAQLLIKAGKKEEANSLLSQAFTTVNEGYLVGDDGEAAFTLINLSKALLEVGRNGEAEVTANKAAAIVRKIKPEAFQGNYGSLFQGLAEVGKRAEALEAARAVADAKSRSNVFLRIADGLIEVRDAGAAEESLDQALEAARQLPVSVDKADALAFAAQRLAVLNKSEKARGVAEEARGVLAEAEKKSAGGVAFPARSTIAEVFVRVGKIEEAVAVAKEMGDDPAYFFDISRTLLRMGRADGALAVANNFTPNSPEIFVIIALHLLKQGDKAGARRSLDMASAAARINFSESNEVVSTVITDLLSGKFNDTEKALEHARSLIAPYPRSMALTGIAEDLADAGKTGEAQSLIEESSALAETISGGDDSERSEIYALIASAQAKLRNFYHARLTAERCRQSKSKLQALTSIYLEYSSMNDPRLAQALKELEKKREEERYAQF